LITRVARFTDSRQWYAGSKSAEAFRQPLNEWAAQIAAAHGRPVVGFEFTDPADDLRRGIPDSDFVHDPVLPLTDKELALARSLRVIVDNKDVSDLGRALYDLAIGRGWIAP